MMNKFQQSGLHGWTHIWHIFHHQHLINLLKKKNHIEFCQDQRTEKVRPEVLTALMMKANLMGYDTASTVTDIADDTVLYPKRNTSWKDLETARCKMACLQKKPWVMNVQYEQRYPNTLICSQWKRWQTMVTNTLISALSILHDHKQGPPLTDCATSTTIHTIHVSEFKIKVSLNSTVFSWQRKLWQQY